jgi:hypothetical protein
VPVAAEMVELLEPTVTVVALILVAVVVDQHQLTQTQALLQAVTVDQA